MIKLTDLLSEKKAYVALVMNKSSQIAMGNKQVNQFKNRGIVGGILQANADRMFKSEVGRNISKPAADKLKVIKHWNQKGLKGSKNPAGRKRQFIDGISGEITAPENAVEWFKDGQILKATNRLDLVIAKSSSKLNSILKSKYNLSEGKLNEEKYVVASVYGDLYTPKAISRDKADKMMMKLAKQYAGDNVFVLGVKYWNKPHKYNKKRIMAKEGVISEASADFVVNIQDTRKNKQIQAGNFTLKDDAKLYMKDMIKKHKLTRYKGFWANPKTGVEMLTNF